MIHDQLGYLFQSLLVIDFWANVNKSTQTARYVIVFPSCLSVENPCDILQKNGQMKKRNSQKKMKMQGKRKGGWERGGQGGEEKRGRGEEHWITLEMKFESDVYGVTEERAAWGYVDAPFKRF